MLIPFKRITLTILFFSAVLVAQKCQPQPAANAVPAQTAAVRAAMTRRRVIQSRIGLTG